MDSMPGVLWLQVILKLKVLNPSQHRVGGQHPNQLTHLGKYNYNMLNQMIVKGQSNPSWQLSLAQLSPSLFIQFSSLSQPFLIEGVL